MLERTNRYQSILKREPKIRLGARGNHAEDLKKPLREDRGLLKTVVEETLQQVLEAEMDEALQGSKGERTARRLSQVCGGLEVRRTDQS